MSRQVLTFLVVFLATSTIAHAELPTGYLVWSKGEIRKPETRRIYRMTLPEKTDVRPLTGESPGEQIECQISPDGQWVAFAKAKLPGSNYHQTKMWKIFIVSIHGVGDGREEIKIDDNGYWPSWGADGRLYYSRVDEDGGSQHARIIRATIDDFGALEEKITVISTREHFPDITDVNECFMSPDGSWFAARTRGDESVSGVGAFTVNPPAFMPLARAGNVGCMPYIAPSGEWGIIAGRDHGIRWGDAPGVPDRLVDQELIAPLSGDDLCYHPGISTDEKWILAAHSTDDNHDSGPYDLYIYELSGKSAGAEQLLVEGGFNGWPHLWIGEPGDPPPPRPHIDSFLPDSWTLVKGESVVLSWQTSFADRVFLESEQVEPDGQQAFEPAVTTAFELIAGSSEVEDTDEAIVEITVNDTPRAVIIDTFSASSMEITAGDSAVLTWSVTNAYQVDIDGRPVPPQGELEVGPLDTSEYTLTATGHEGPVQATLTIEVEKLTQGLPDRGGCFCGSSADIGWSLVGLLLALLVLRRRIGG